MTRKARILLYESNETILQMMKFNFEMEGFEVLVAPGTDGILSTIVATEIDIVILNWSDNSENCLNICEAIRGLATNFYTPVLIISAPREENMRIAAYRLGADDFLSKPFSLPELLARIRAILRRTSPAVGGRVIRVAGLEMDIDHARVSRDGDELQLSQTEFKILRYLMEHAGKVRSREQIRNAVWGKGSQVELRAVDVRITRLRRRLNNDGRIDAIRTIRSVGYALGDTTGWQHNEASVEGA